MEIIKIIGVGLIGLILVIVLKQYKPEFTIYISFLVVAIILIMFIDNLAGIIDSLAIFSSKANMNSEFLGILIKITGIAFLTEFAVSICKDSGETAIASKIDLGGKIMIVAISVPILSALLELVVKILP